MATELDTTTAQKINELHQGLTVLLHHGIEKAIEIGELLTAKKAELKHGEFGAWIKDNLVFTDRSARNYMRLYDNRDKVLEAGNISEAYKMLAAHDESGNVSDLEYLIPAHNRMSIIDTDNPKCEEIYIFTHEQPGYFRTIWIEKDSFDGAAACGDIRGLSKAGLLMRLGILLKNTKNISLMTITEDDEFKKTLRSMIA